MHATPDLLVVCVNTTRAWRHKHGEVSSLQIERVARRLANAEAAQLRIVVVHQPVAVTRAEDVQNLLRGHEAALRRWAAAGADIVMGGHIHLPYVMPLHDLARPLWAVQAGTAVSHRVRHGTPNSVNLIRWEPPADGAVRACCVNTEHPLGRIGEALRDKAPVRVVLCGLEWQLVVAARRLQDDADPLPELASTGRRVETRRGPSPKPTTRPRTPHRRQPGSARSWRRAETWRRTRTGPAR